MLEFIITTKTTTAVLKASYDGSGLAAFVKAFHGSVHVYDAWDPFKGLLASSGFGSAPA